MAIKSRSVIFSLRIAKLWACAANFLSYSNHIGTPH